MQTGIAKRRTGRQRPPPLRVKMSETVSGVKCTEQGE